MTKENKLIASNTILLYARSIVLLIINLFISRISLHILGVSDYGIYQVVGGLVAFFAIVSSTMTSASQRFITYALGTKDEIVIKQTFSTCISIHFILALGIVLLLETLGIWLLYKQLNIPEDRIMTAVWVMQFSIASFFVNVISVPYTALVIAHERMNMFAYLTLFEGILRLMCVVSLYVVVGDKLLIYAFIFFIVALIIRLSYSIYCKKNFKETHHCRFSVNKRLFKQMFSFAGWNMIGNSAMILRNQGIDIILNIFFGVTINAAKGICNQVQSAVMQLVGNFTVSVTPQLTKSVAQKDYSRTNKLVFHGSKMAFFLMMLIAIPFISCCHSILHIWLGKVPEYATEMVQLTFIYMLSDAMSRFLINAILAYGDIKWFQLVNGGIKLLALPLTYLFLKQGGSPLTGIIINIVLEFICVAGRLYFNKKQLGFKIKHFVLHVLLRCWGIFLLSFLTVYFFCNYVSDNVFLVCVFSFLLSTFIIWSVGVNSYEKDFIIKVLHSLCLLSKRR